MATSSRRRIAWNSERTTTTREGRRSPCRHRADPGGFEVNDLQAAHTELVAAGVQVIGEIERDSKREWLTFRGADGNLDELASRL